MARTPPRLLRGRSLPCWPARSLGVDMTMAKAAKKLGSKLARKLARPRPYPEPVQIADHLWIALNLALQGNPCNARTILRDFCKVFEIPPEAVEQRFKEEDEALSEPNRTLH